MGPLTAEDFTTWKMVTTRAPRAGEAPTAFYDLPRLRSGDELVLTLPRVGFFSTPAFFANWQTNEGNQMRVTMNQTLIVALGAQVDGTDATRPPSTPGLAAEHAGGGMCLFCHQTLDPTRSLFSSTFSWTYHAQEEKAFSDEPGLFAFQGVVKPVKTLDELGETLATHPLFAPAWVGKLCAYANSRECDRNDPELQRVTEAFKASGFSFSTLVRELFSSPVTTNAARVAAPEVVAVARRDHLCAALDARLGLADICGLAGRKAKAEPLATIDKIVPGLPSDGYGRGAVAPVLPNAPTLFYRAGAENVCASVADLVIDPAEPRPDR
jgi:hypothetical protein